MSNEGKKFVDIYLWTVPNNDKLIKIEHLTYDEAIELSSKWLNCKKSCDYMIVQEGFIPSFFGNPSVEVKTKEWIESI